MTPRGRRHAAAAWATADLFAGTQPPSAAQPATAAQPASATQPAPAVQPTTAQATPPRPKPLWHAVVFAGQEASLLPRLCLSAQRFTSWVSIEPPDALLMEIKGSVQLFGSLPALRDAIDAEWTALSLRAHSATAPTALAALWLARAGQSACIEDAGRLAGALAELPLACTAWDAAWLQTLRAMGVTRIGELLRLPRAGLARRLSPAAVLDLDRALARQADPRRAFVPRRRFRERCDFETEVESVVYVQKALEPLLERCARFLRERQAGVQTLELRLRHRAIPMTRVRVGLASVTSDRRRCAAVLDEKLQRLELAAPVRGMELLSGALQPLSADSLDAFAALRGGLGAGVGAGGVRAPQLVERLRARLGAAAVYGVYPIAEHRPEAAWQRVHELRLTSVVRSDARGLPVADMPRPVWLLAEPELLPAPAPPSDSSGLVLVEGPERIESGWWDGRGVTRDYYVARALHGARWWVFQERRTQCWYLHGVFA